MAEGGGEGQATGARTGAHDVFVSYASQDTAVANTIVENLEQHGLRCWMAPRDVKPGAQYADAIVGAINEAEAVVLVLSQSAIASSHVAREVERAASKHKPIIAFRIDVAALNRALEYFLSNSQWIDVMKLGMPVALVKLSEAVAQESGNALDPIIPTKPVEGAGGRAKLIAVSAAVLGVSAAMALGIHLWTSKPRSAQAQAVVASGARERAASPISDKSIAVLPFTDMSEKKDQEYFADGMAEEVLDLLTKVPGIRVIGRTSSFQFKGKSGDLRSISRTLGAIYIIEGSVRKSGDRLRVTAQLIGAVEGTTVDTGIESALMRERKVLSSSARAGSGTVWLRAASRTGTTNSVLSRLTRCLPRKPEYLRCLP